MAPKIERGIGTVLSAIALRRKDAAEQDNPGQKENRERQEKPKQEEAEQRQADKRDVEKAITDLRTTAQFSQNGLRVEMLEGKDGLTVKLTNASGNTIKVMTAEEFLKLRDGAAACQPRGKILDQKF